MDNNEIVELIKQTPNILTIIYGDLAQPSVKKIGIALETVFEFSTSFLLPVKLLNEKFKLNFEKRLNEYRDKLNAISDDELCKVNPQIGTPLIEKLSYITNDEIADLFTNLLTKASSTKTVNLAHPSFVQLLERLSVDEARIIKLLLDKDYVPCVSFPVHLKENKGFLEIIKNETMIQYQIELLFPENTKTYLENLVSMGVFDISHGCHKTDESIYNPIYEKYGYDKLNDVFMKSGEYERLEKLKSYYQITDFGKSFIRACNPNVVQKN